MKALHWHAEICRGRDPDGGECSADAAAGHDALPPLTPPARRLRSPGAEPAHVLPGERRAAGGVPKGGCRPSAYGVRRLGVALVLERCLQIEQEAFGPDAGHAGPMVAAIAEVRPEAASATVQRVIADPKSSLGPVMPVVLDRLGEVAPDQLVEVADGLLALHVPAIDTLVSPSSGWNRGLRHRSSRANSNCF